MQRKKKRKQGTKGDRQHWLSTCMHIHVSKHIRTTRLCKYKTYVHTCTQTHNNKICEKSEVT